SLYAISLHDSLPIFTPVVLDMSTIVQLPTAFVRQVTYSRTDNSVALSPFDGPSRLLVVILMQWTWRQQPITPIHSTSSMAWHGIDRKSTRLNSSHVK